MARKKTGKGTYQEHIKSPNCLFMAYVGKGRWTQCTSKRAKIPGKRARAPFCEYHMQVMFDSK